MGSSKLITHGFKSHGEGGWEAIWSNIFYDRDVSHDAPMGERFPLSALKEFAAWANEDPANMPVLEFWHLDNMQIGQTKQIEVIGPYIWASGVWADTELGQKAKSYFSSPEAATQDWAMSHGYKYRLEDFVDGEIRQFRTRELTVLPEKWAANPLTLFTEDTSMSDAKKSLKTDIVAALASVFGKDSKEIESIIEEGASRKELKPGEAAGLKESDTTEAAATTPDGPGEDEDLEDADEDVEDDALAEALVATLKQAAEQASTITALEATVKSLVEEVASMKTTFGADVKALKDESKARKQLLPKALADALATREKAAAAAVPAEEVTQDMNKQGASLTGQKAFEVDPIGWFEDQAGISAVPPQL